VAAHLLRAGLSHAVPGIRHLSTSLGPRWEVVPSVTELNNHTANGDAFFADYTLIASISHHF
jgi:hypothetical protein